MARSFAVLGSGICGITTANLLLDAYPDAKVTIYTNGAQDIVTLVAGAQFYPIWLGDDLPQGYDNLLRKWLLTSKRKFIEHSQQGLAVYHTRNYELFMEPTEPPAYFYDVLSNFEAGADSALPPPYTYRYAFDTMIINPIKYLPQITKAFASRGGIVARKHFADLSEVLQLKEKIIFNCLGLGAQTIFGDELIKPVKGFSFRLPPIPALRCAVSAGDFIIAPRGDEIYLGAPYMTKWKTEQPTEQEQAYVFDGIKAIVEAPGTPFSLPKDSLRRERVIEMRTGFRPVRTTGLRVEKEIIGNKAIIHNYGHGGNGVILSWGTAAHSLGLV